MQAGRSNALIVAVRAVARRRGAEPQVLDHWRAPDCENLKKIRELLSGESPFYLSDPDAERFSERLATRAEQRSSAAHIAVSYRVRISSERDPLKKASLEGE
jgi:hypothetical protein